MKKHFFLYLLTSMLLLVSLSVKSEQTSTTAKDLTLDVVRWARTYYDYSHLMCCQFECQDGYYFDFYLKLNEDAIEYNHTYTIAEMDTKNTYGRRGSAAIVYQTAQLTFSLDELEREVADFIVEDVSGNRYRVSFRYKPLPEMVDTLPIVIKDADFTDDRFIAYHNYYTFQGRADSLEFVFCVKSEQLVGDIAEKDVYIGTYSPYTYGTIYHANGTYTDINVGRALNGKVEKGIHEDDYICTVDLLCYDGHCYHVTFRYEQPEPKEQVDVHFTNMKFNEEFYLQFGVYSYVGSTDDYRTEIILYSPATPGHTYVVPTEVGTVWLFNTQTQTEVACYKYSNVTVTGSADKPIIHADLLAKDSILYHITLENIKPSSTREETLNVQGRFKDMIAESGRYQATAQNTDKSRIVSLMINTKNYAGHFTEADLDAKYTYILQDYVENTTNGTTYKLIEADITAQYTKSTKTLTFTGTLLCENGNKPSDIPLFTLNMTCVLDEGLDYDCDDQDIDAYFASEQMAIETQYDSYSKITAFMVTAENDNSQLVGLLFLAKNVTDSKLPAGTYPVNANMTAPSLVASGGVDAQSGSVSFSFLSTLTAAGGLASPIWFFRGGAAVVSYVGDELRIEINATNSYNRKIHIEMGAGVSRDLSNLLAEDWTATTTDHSSTICSMTSKDGTYYIQVEINATTLQDSMLYQSHNMNLGNCYAVALKTQDTIHFVRAEFIYHLNAVQIETAQIQGQSAQEITYGISCQKAIPAREETITIEDAELSNYVQEYGEFQLRGTNESRDRLVSVAIFTNQIVGHFSERDMDASFTYVIDDPDDDGNAVIHELVRADVNVTVSEQDSMLYLIGTLICRNMNDSADVALYHIHMSTTVNIVEGLPYDAPQEQGYDHVFDANKIKWDKDYFGQNGSVFMEVHDVKGNTDDFIYIGFYVPYLDNFTTVPVGQYAINYSGKSMTVMASSGISPTGGAVAASFVAKKNVETGFIEPPLWFLQSGTVTVEADKNSKVHILIDAVNSCGAPVTIEVKNIKTDLMDIETEQSMPRKIIQDGHIYIIRDNEKFNLNGTKL